MWRPSFFPTFPADATSCALRSSSQCCSPPALGLQWLHFCVAGLRRTKHKCLHVFIFSTSASHPRISKRKYLWSLWTQVGSPLFPDSGKGFAEELTSGERHQREMGIDSLLHWEMGKINICASIETFKIPKYLLCNLLSNFFAFFPEQVIRMIFILVCVDLLLVNICSCH